MIKMYQKKTDEKGIYAEEENEMANTEDTRENINKAEK